MCSGDFCEIKIVLARSSVFGVRVGSLYAYLNFLSVIECYGVSLCVFVNFCLLVYLGG